jgi:Ca2+-transporting ATPase
MGDSTLIMLMVLATINVGIGIYQEKSIKGAIDGIAVYLAVSIIVCITSANNYSKEKQFQKLVAGATDECCTCFRGSEGLTKTI